MTYPDFDPPKLSKNIDSTNEEENAKKEPESLKYWRNRQSFAAVDQKFKFTSADFYVCVRIRIHMF